jgi:hypothetical protein
LYGAGFSNGQASFISNSFANTMSSNAGSPQQSSYLQNLFNSNSSLSNIAGDLQAAAQLGQQLAACSVTQ